MILWVLEMVMNLVHYTCTSLWGLQESCFVLLVVVSVGSKRRFLKLALSPFFLDCHIGYIGNNLMAVAEHCYRMRVVLAVIVQIGYIGNKLVAANLR